MPTVADLIDRFIEGYARANRQKPSGIAGKLTILHRHLLPRLGSKKRDAITNEDTQRLKSALGDKAAKTVNNVLTVLNVLLKTAVSWDVIDCHPCSIRLLPTPLLGGDAGLRPGEMMALER